MGRRTSLVAAQRRRLSVLLHVVLVLTVGGLIAGGVAGWKLVTAEALSADAASYANEHRILRKQVGKLEAEQADARETSEDANAASAELFRKLEFPTDDLTADETTDLSNRLDAATQVTKKAGADYLAVSRSLNETSEDADRVARQLLRATAQSDSDTYAGMVALFFGGPVTIIFGVASLVLWLARGKHDARYAMAN